VKRVVKERVYSILSISFIRKHHSGFIPMVRAASRLTVKVRKRGPAKKSGFTSNEHRSFPG